MTTEREAKYTPWVRFNQLDATYDTADGTKVPAELVENIECLADVLRIAAIRARQRAAKVQGERQ